MDTTRSSPVPNKSNGGQQVKAKWIGSTAATSTGSSARRLWRAPLGSLDGENNAGSVEILRRHSDEILRVAAPLQLRLPPTLVMPPLCRLGCPPPLSSSGGLLRYTGWRGRRPFWCRRFSTPPAGTAFLPLAAAVQRPFLSFTRASVGVAKLQRRTSTNFFPTRSFGAAIAHVNLEQRF
jgi:hypothetical protein